MRKSLLQVKRLCSFLVLVVFASLVYGQVIMPKFSTDEKEVWYFLRFKNGLGTIMDMGEGQNLLVAETDPCAEQLWKFVGTPSDFELVNKAGRSICYNGSKFIAKTGGKANLSLMATKNNTYFPGWEIQITGYDYPSMNQYQGAGIGRTLSVWNANDGNNPLDFIAEED
ncbi:MAG: hypothetical protein II222_02050, partial [Paraprevotella sp.]|nr:hypothetical protein [Paraprevotella sp.]